MNANELAVYLEDITDWEESPYRQAATMLRQQAKELDEAGGMIGVLREYISDLENGLDSSIKLNKTQAERNNEPVAYVNSMCNDYIDWKADPMSIDGQPLYTHPVKELTDEEIHDLIVNKVTDYDMIKQALRKAQEK